MTATAAHGRPAKPFTACGPSTVAVPPAHAPFVSRRQAHRARGERARRAGRRGRSEGPAGDGKQDVRTPRPDQDRGHGHAPEPVGVSHLS